MPVKVRRGDIGFPGTEVKQMGMNCYVGAGN